MQDIQVDVVAPEQLVREILGRQSMMPPPLLLQIPPPTEEFLEEEKEEMDISRRGSEETMKEVTTAEETDEEKRNNGDLVILDCSAPQDYQECHIKGALNVTFPAIMIRRIAAGKIDIFEKSKELKAIVTNSKITFVVYDSFMEEEEEENQGGPKSSDLVHLIAKKLAQNGCKVATLKGGLSAFRELYPEWVETSGNFLEASSTSSAAEPSPLGLSTSPAAGRVGEVPLLGLGSLASLTIHDDPSDECDSCLGFDPDDIFPVEIIPNLYLGNASISADLSLLERHNIKHILNVTPDLPNSFEDTIRYLQIPISDHWTQSMFTYFVPAIQFIDEGRLKEEGVLVHCLAGISRSVTITMAYIMYKMSLSLNDAYDIVRAKKANISPNFHFMNNLLEFERQLHSQFLSPAGLGCSPDSGIEFDRFN